MSTGFIRRILSPIVELREDESVTALLMFLYAYLGMTSYNIVQPLTRSKLIESLGAVNVPYVVLANGVFIGVLMLGYTRLFSALPRRWALPIIQAGMTLIMFAFWVLFRTGGGWVSVAFYIWGAIIAILLISQFWTLANGIYDPRQAKRLFGFVGGGVALGGMTGSGLTALIVERIGANAMLLVSTVVLGLCVPLAAVILGREKSSVLAVEGGGVQEEKGVTIARAFQLLRESKQVKLVALVIAFGSLGAALIDQQVNMAAEAVGGGNSVSKFLAQIRFGISAAAFIIQVWLTPVIHRYLGIGFALILLPTNLFATAAAILLTKNVWATAVATTMDRSVRYSVDKTTREVLFLPLPTELRQEVKPFVDVTVDRVARGVGAVLILLLVQPWGLGLTWPQISYVSLGLTAVWYVMASRAKRQYLASFRQSFERHDIEAAQVRVNVADLSTVETLVEELSSPDEQRVVYAIDLLESLDKRNLITPLLLYHESPNVRGRALAAMEGVRRDLAERWLPAIEGRLKDTDHEVRLAAVRALATIRRERAAEVMRPFLGNEDPRLVATAAIALADSSVDSDVEATEQALQTLVEDTRESRVEARRDVARIIPLIQNPRFRHLLIPLFYDPDVTVALEAIRSAAKIGAADALFVPALVSLSRNRLLKGAARNALVGYGEAILDVMAHFVRDQDEDIWVRRHIPGTLARIPSQKSVDLLTELLGDPDGFIRYKALTAIETITRDHPEFTLDRARLEALTLNEGAQYFNYLSLDYSLRRADKEAGDTLLGRALEEKRDRAKDRVYRFLGLIHPWKDIAAARWALERGDNRVRASAAEYLDNLLKGDLRKRIMPVLEDLPIDERVRKANVLLRSRVRDLEETVVQLVHDPDQGLASAAIHYVEARKLWALGDDLEHILAHRDVRDWNVFEAASWALASQRMTAAERRARWREPLPAVEVADRLRRIPLFAFVSVDELYGIAATGRQLRHETGQRLQEQGARAGTFQFLLDGRSRSTAEDGKVRDVEAPSTLVLGAALESTPIPETITALEPSITLALGTDDFNGLLSDNVQLAHGLFRMLLSGPGAAAWPPVVPPRMPFDERAANGSLRPIERVLALEQVPLFAHATADELQAVASIAHEGPVAAGSDLFKEGQLAAIYTVLRGRVQITRDGKSPVVAAPGDTIGIVETLGDRLTEESAKVLESGYVLRIDREALFELLSNRIELLHGLFGTVQTSRAEVT
jgi:ATP:ADP antiporter, AAA family